jgi:hypothetical protein
MSKPSRGHTDETSLRARLTSALGRDVEPWLWELLDNGAYTWVEDEQQFKDLVKQARYLMRVIPAGRMRPSRPRQGQTASLQRESWQSKALALADYRAVQASRLSQVVRFRRGVLGGKLLSEDAARRFIRANCPEAVRAGLLLAFPGREWVERVKVEHASVLGRLCVVAGELCKKYGWRDYAATWFVLTGLTPLNWPLEIDEVEAYDPHRRVVAIRLAVAPWMPAHAVLKAFINLQKKLAEASSRPLSDRRVALLRFETEAPAGSAREKLTRWNRAFPKWAYRDVRNFRRDLKAAQRQIAASDFRLDLAGD